MFTATVPLTRPASPAEVITNSPLPFDTVTKSVVPSPRATFTFDNATLTTRFGTTPVASKLKSPLMRWLRMLALTPFPSTRTNGPIGKVSVVGIPATSNVSFTTAFVLLIETLNEALISTFGIVTATSPLMRPASPADVMMKTPSPLFTRRKVFAPSPSLRLTSRTPARTFDAVCSKVNEPLSVCPTTRRFTSSPVTRRKGPEGSESVCTPPPTSSPSETESSL